jgi:hypothetical protein
VNRTLSLAIPTHNRFSILRENLLELLPELEETGVTVHIADSGTDEVTRDGIGELQRAYPRSSYRRSAPALAAFANAAIRSTASSSVQPSSSPSSSRARRVLGT